jgi:hypothetical protein
MMKSLKRPDHDCKSQMSLHTIEVFDCKGKNRFILIDALDCLVVFSSFL